MSPPCSRPIINMQRRLKRSSLFSLRDLRRAVHLSTHPHHCEQLQQVLREGQDWGGDPRQEEEILVGGGQARSVEQYSLIKGTVQRDFRFQIFLWISFPKPLGLPLGPFWIFPKICGGIRSSRCTTGVINSGGKGKNLQSEKFNYFFKHLCAVELTYR